MEDTQQVVGVHWELEYSVPKEPRSWVRQLADSDRKKVEERAAYYRDIYIGNEWRIVRVVKYLEG